MGTPNMRDEVVRHLRALYEAASVRMGAPFVGEIANANVDLHLEVKAAGLWRDLSYTQGELTEAGAEVLREAEGREVEGREVEEERPPHKPVEGLRFDHGYEGAYAVSRGILEAVRCGGAVDFVIADHPNSGSTVYATVRVHVRPHRSGRMAAGHNVRVFRR